MSSYNDYGLRVIDGMYKFTVEHISGLSGMMAVGTDTAILDDDRLLVIVDCSIYQCSMGDYSDYVLGKTGWDTSGICFDVCIGPAISAHVAHGVVVTDTKSVVWDGESYVRTTDYSDVEVSLMIARADVLRLESRIHLAGGGVYGEELNILRDIELACIESVRLASKVVIEATVGKYNG